MRHCAQPANLDPATPIHQSHHGRGLQSSSGEPAGPGLHGGRGRQDCHGQAEGSRCGCPQTPLCAPAQFEQFLDALDCFLADVAGTGWTKLPAELTSVIATYLTPVVPKKAVTEDTIAEWTKRPETFFNLPDDEDPPRWLYRRLEALSQPQLDPVDEVTRRVCLVLFHDLRQGFSSRFNKPKRDPLAIYLARDDAVGDPDEVKKNCANWSNIGAKYKTLVKDSGGNGGLLVPTTIGRAT